MPLTDSQDYDLVVDGGEGLRRVQVKTTTYKRRNRYQVGMAVKGGNRSGTGKTKAFDSTKADLVFVVTGDLETYLIPSGKVSQNFTLNESFDIYRVR